jgi:hypothetical protein
VKVGNGGERPEDIVEGGGEHGRRVSAEDGRGTRILSAPCLDLSGETAAAQTHHRRADRVALVECSRAADSRTLVVGRAR